MKNHHSDHRSAMSRVGAAVLLAASLMTVSASASARDHGRGDRHGWHHDNDRWDHRHGHHHHHHRDVRIVERRYVVREAPRYYYEPRYERPRHSYYDEPGLTVRIGLPPIIIPFD